MLKTLAAAVIAAGLIAGPVLAQAPGGSVKLNSPAANSQTTVKTEAGKSGVKASGKTSVKAKATVKKQKATIVKKVKKAKKHTAKAVKLKKHVKHLKAVKPMKRVTAHTPAR